jgi:chloramphenicol-sensitive protein RarD
MNKGVWYAIGAYTLWGVFPIYWKLIHSVPALEIIGHRVIWSFVFVVLITLTSGKWADFKEAIRDRKNIRPFILTAILLSINWFTYVWAVNAGYIVESSLGYFINPLVSVLLGVVFMKERLRIWQWVSVSLAFVGIAYLTWLYGSLPWIGLTLAFTFAFYGLIKKKARLNAIQGIIMETGFMGILAFGYLLVLEIIGDGAFGNQPLWVLILLVLAGVVTGLPLLMFGAAARLIPLSTLGFLQYIAPTLQFLIGIVVYREPFSPDRLLGFGLIWIALAVFSFEGFVARRKASSQVSLESAS